MIVDESTASSADVEVPVVEQVVEETKLEPIRSESPLTKLNSEEYAAWRRTGELPGDKPKEGEEAATSEGKEKDTRARDEDGKFIKADAGKTEKVEKKPAAKERELTPQQQETKERFDKLTESNRQLKAENDRLLKPSAPKETKAEEAAPPKEEKPKEKAAETAIVDARPKLEDFTDYDDYVVALGRWSAREENRVIKAEEEKQAEAKQAEAAKAEFEKEWKTREKAAREKYEDFDAKVQKFSETIPRHSVLEMFMIQDPMGLDVLYALASDPKEYERISKLSTISQAEALIDLRRAIAKPTQETQLDSEKEHAAPQPKTTSRANRPPREVGDNSDIRDPAMAASARGDTGAFIDLENKREGRLTRR